SKAPPKKNRDYRYKGRKHYSENSTFSVTLNSLVATLEATSAGEVEPDDEYLRMALLKVAPDAAYFLNTYEETGKGVMLGSLPAFLAKAREQAAIDYSSLPPQEKNRLDAELVRNLLHEAIQRI